MDAIALRAACWSMSADAESPSDQVLWVIVGAVSSVGEHCAYNAGVGGSNPSPPTS
jgi:hypothetical protein